jgi:hypothetical protein
MKHADQGGRNLEVPRMRRSLKARPRDAEGAAIEGDPDAL